LSIFIFFLFKRDTPIRVFKAKKPQQSIGSVLHTKKEQSREEKE